MRLLGYDADWLGAPERFDEGCAAIGIDCDLWRARIDAEVAWFDLYRRAFAPENLLAQPDTVPVGARPLLIDGAVAGCRHVMLDGGEAEGIGWVQKQDRRHSFPDPQQLWPAIAAALDGDHTIEALAERFALGPEAVAVLSRLHGLGFVAYV